MSNQYQQYSTVKKYWHLMRPLWIIVLQELLKLILQFFTSIDLYATFY
ncbi:hypothetical protein [Staphylococcus aureus]|nr:hypothetical protein [Staphylococcus aureus]MDE8497754.1 hypothetical protein [Staphylococcus aureus]